ncbi:MAG: formyltransferase family protein [Planctomycetaceae bacterium]
MVDSVTADQRQLNVLLVGEEAAAIQTLRSLAAGPHHVVAVMATPDAPAQAAGLWNTAQRMGFPTWPASLVKQDRLAQQVADHAVDLILNVHSLFIMHPAVIQAARIGAFNMHPGPLPEYAGLNVPSWAIYHGETDHGVTIHEMVDQIDAGTIAYQQRFPIAPEDTGMSLMLKCVRAGLPLLARLLEDAAISKDQIPRIEQHFQHRRYLYGAAPNNGHMCWHRSAMDVSNHVRAADYSPFASPWGHPTNRYRGTTIGIAKTSRTGETCTVEPGTIGRIVQAGVLVAAEDEWIQVEKLEIHEKRVEARSVLSSGDRLEESSCQSLSLER